MAKIVEIVLLVSVLVAIAGCESTRSAGTTPAETIPADQTDESAELVETIEAEEPSEAPSVFAEEATEKYRLANQLLEFAGPIDDFSSESNNVRLLAADLLTTAIELDPTEFKYYRDLFMTYMVLQEPVKAIEAIEPASNTPALADEVAEFQLLIFGALEFATLLNSES